MPKLSKYLDRATFRRDSLNDWILISRKDGRNSWAVYICDYNLEERISIPEKAKYLYVSILREPPIKKMDLQKTLIVEMNYRNGATYVGNSRNYLAYGTINRLKKLFSANEIRSFERKTFYISFEWS